MTELVNADAERASPVSEPAWADRNHAVVMLGLSWLQALVRAALERRRAGVLPGGPVEASSLHAPASPADASPPSLGALDDAPGADPAVAAARLAYENARAELRRRHEPAALDRLAVAFDLSPFDEDVVLVAAAPRLDASFQALYSEAHGRPRLFRATPHLALSLLAPGPEAQIRGLARLGPAAPLRRFALVTFEDGGPDVLAAMDVDERVAAYILGRDELDPRVRPCLRPVPGGICPARHEQAVRQGAEMLARARRPALHVLGPRASGRHAAATEVARRVGLGLVELDPRALPAEPAARHGCFALIARDARLSRFAVIVDASPGRGGDEGARLAREAAADALAGLDAVVLVLAEERISSGEFAPVMRLADLDAGDRAALWRHALGPGADTLSPIVDRLAEQFALGPGEIAAVAGAEPHPDAGALWAACREAAGRALDGLAQRVVPRFGWDDIVLPPAVLHDLRALAAQVRHRAVVYGRWGFARRLPRGRGVTALVAGPTGVGKTMAAEVIAGDLGLDLYRIDLSGVVSKYIGETEKNLRRVFDAAEAGGAVLFFDEADALFGRRSEVRDSHDRYANIEVSYLLQRMEAYSGLAILATNLKSHLDAAFLRRLRYVIDIPFPDASARREIWAKAFPAGAPTRDLDLDALARLDIAGGHITVIAVNAAFLAAADGVPIDMSHVARAARAEFRKLDKTLHPAWPGER